ncbi:hypothetical protein Tco_0383363 [Tanacetum coccineum]
MDVTAMKHMASNFTKLDKFEGNVESSKELWASLEAKYMAGDASSKKFLVSNFINYKMTDPRPVMKQYNKLLGILGSHLRIEESLRMQDSDKPKGNNVVGPSVVNMVEHNNSFRLNIVNDNIASAFMSTSKLNDSIDSLKRYIRNYEFCLDIDAVVVRLHKKFYNSLGSVHGRCSVV